MGSEMCIRDRLKAQRETMKKSRARIGMACNKSNTRIDFVRSDATSPDALFLFDSDFPTWRLVTRGIRDVWTNVTIAAELWTTRLLDTENDLCEIDREQRNNLLRFVDGTQTFQTKAEIKQYKNHAGIIDR